MMNGWTDEQRCADLRWVLTTVPARHHSVMCPSQLARHDRKSQEYQPFKAI